jgi:hypothetical protein
MSTFLAVWTERPFSVSESDIRGTALDAQDAPKRSSNEARGLITAVGSAMAFGPRLVRAQPAKIPTVGVLVVGAPRSDKF